MDYRAHGAPRAEPDLDSTPVLTPGFNSPSVPVPQTESSGGGMFTPPPAPPQVEVFPWWDRQWAAAQAWRAKVLNATVVAGQTAGQSTFLTGFTYTVPANMRAVLKAMKMTVQNPVATINLALTLFKGGAPIQGWDGIAFDPVAATALILPFNDMNITLEQGDVITAAFAEASAPASGWTVSLQAYGWQITQADIDRVQPSLKY